MNERDLRRIYGKNFDSVKNKKYTPISIIITAYNSDIFIESCLDSIVNQTYFVNNDNYEILLGIDGCEKTLNKILNISYKYKKLKIYMMKSNMGTYVTTNTLIDLCSFDKIIRFDSDDIMCDNMIERLVGYNEYDIVRFMCYTFTNTIVDSYVKNNRYSHGVALFNKNVFNKAGGYQDWVCAADTELLERVKNHFNIKLINERLFHRRIHENSLTKRKDVGFFSDVRNQYETQIREFDSSENIYIAKKINLFSEYNYDYYINFFDKYKQKRNVDYDCIIIISSYNRYDNLINIINQITQTKTKYKYKIIVLDDGSDILIDLSMYNDITLLKNEINYGKQLYWKTISKLFKESSKYSSHCIIQIDDDFLLTKNFLNKVINRFFELKKENNEYVAIKLHLEDIKGDLNRWGFKLNWIDGGGLYDTNFVNYINNEIPEINKDRWKHNPMLSSGVWQKVSEIINTNKLLIYCPEVSYMKHAGNKNSMMNPEERKNNIINTYNFDCNE